MLVLRCISCPTVKLIALQEHLEAIIVTIINNHVFAVYIVHPEILLSSELSSLPIYIMA